MKKTELSNHYEPETFSKASALLPKVKTCNKQQARWPGFLLLCTSSLLTAGTVA